MILPERVIEHSVVILICSLINTFAITDENKWLTERIIQSNVNLCKYYLITCFLVYQKGRLKIDLRK